MQVTNDFAHTSRSVTNLWTALEGTHTIQVCLYTPGRARSDSVREDAPSALALTGDDPTLVAKDVHGEGRNVLFRHGGRRVALRGVGLRLAVHVNKDCTKHGGS